ncbi:MAG: NUDIX domain-containing protein [Myxococcales bacterium]|nr:NUDIX domain-containing protein [Myxococcales bacterium]
MGQGITTWCFVLVAVRKGDRLLVVHEAKHGQKWWLPAGAVDEGETLEEAAVRETLEEAGVHVTLDGVVRIERSVVTDGARLRVIFTGTVADDAEPKRVADRHSLEARWCTLKELEALDLRGSEPLDLARYFARGGPVYPLSVLTAEQAPL